MAGFHTGMGKFKELELPLWPGELRPEHNLDQALEVLGGSWCPCYKGRLMNEPKPSTKICCTPP